MKFKAEAEENKKGRAGLLMPEELRESLVGKMCQIIEMLGLKDSQEKATIDSVKNAIYDMLGHDGSAEFIDSGLFSVILDVIWQERNYSREHGLHIEVGNYSLVKDITLAKDLV